MDADQVASDARISRLELDVVSICEALVRVEVALTAVSSLLRRVEVIEYHQKEDRK